jgi:hypothetical protein
MEEAGPAFQAEVVHHPGEVVEVGRLLKGRRSPASVDQRAIGDLLHQVNLEPELLESPHPAQPDPGLPAVAQLAGHRSGDDHRRQPMPPSAWSPEPGPGPGRAAAGSPGSSGG